MTFLLAEFSSPCSAQVEGEKGKGQHSLAVFWLSVVLGSCWAECIKYSFASQNLREAKEKTPSLV